MKRVVDVSAIVFWGVLIIIGVFFIAQITPASNEPSSWSLQDLGKKAYPDNNAIGWLIILGIIYVLMKIVKNARTWRSGE